MRQGRAEVGSEIELAANRKPYLDDEELEGQASSTARCGFGLRAAGRHRRRPAALLAGRARPAGRRGRGLQRDLHHRGEDVYNDEAPSAPTATAPRASAACADYTLTDANGDFVRQVSWKAPALNTVLLPLLDATRCSYILNYGRRYSPMPAWGAPAVVRSPTSRSTTSSPTSAASSSPPSDAPGRGRSRRSTRSCEPDADGNCTRRPDAASPADARRGALQPGLSTTASPAAPTPAPAATPRAGPTASPQVAGGGGASARTSTGGSELRQFETAEQQQVDFVQHGLRAGKRYGTRRHRRGPDAGLRRQPERRSTPASAPTITGMNPAQVMLHPGPDRRRRRPTSGASDPMLPPAPLRRHRLGPRHPRHPRRGHRRRRAVRLGLPALATNLGRPAGPARRPRRPVRLARRS